MTKVRYRVIGVTTLASVILYLDRICIAEIAKLDQFKAALGISDLQKGAILASFFFTYALAQVPAGWLSDRLGARKMMPIYIAIWSVCTVLTGLAQTFAMFIAARLLFGLSQAGCYPTAGSLIKRWMPLPQRGRASSVVAFGGRVGGAVAPILTAWLLKEYLGWRAVLVLYGLSGLFVAALFWKEFRETPTDHPNCDDEEREWIVLGEAEHHDQGPPPFPPILPLLKSPTMWMMCALQFGINFGWGFLVSWLPTYLKEVRNVEPSEGGLMSTVVLFAGIVGMLLGGPLTDFTAKRFGRRWGRSIPLVVCYTGAVIAYTSSLQFDSTWTFIAVISLVAFATDISVPGIWAYMQDVGGKNTAAVFGWGNMWGNLGAGTVILLVPIVRNKWDVNGDWHEAFMLFSVGFILAAVCALGLNSERKIES